MDYPKLISEKWNLTAKFNCLQLLQAIYCYAPSALAVPMCAFFSVYAAPLADIARSHNIEVHVYMGHFPISV